MGEAAVHEAKRPQAKEVILDAFSLLPIGERQNLEGMSEAAAHGVKRLYTREDNIMPIVKEWTPWLVHVVVCYFCDKSPYVRFYGFGIVLLVLTDYNI